VALRLCSEQKGLLGTQNTANARADYTSTLHTEIKAGYLPKSNATRNAPPERDKKRKKKEAHGEPWVAPAPLRSYEVSVKPQAEGFIPRKEL
jgi:hypothetical protein